MLPLRILAPILCTSNIEPLRSTRLIAGEIIALQQNWTQNRMIGIYTGINQRYDSGAGDPEAILGILKADDLRRWLRRITMPHYGTVIIHRRSVIEPVRNAREMGLRQWLEIIRLDANNPEE